MTGPLSSRVRRAANRPLSPMGDKGPLPHACADRPPIRATPKRGRGLAVFWPDDTPKPDCRAMLDDEYEYED